MGERREGDDQRNSQLFSLLLLLLLLAFALTRSARKKILHHDGEALCLKNVMNCTSCEQEARH